MESEIIEHPITETTSTYDLTFIDGHSRVVLYCDSKEGAQAIQNALACHAKDISIFE